RAAAASFAVPAQNIVYADVDGNIGYQAPGDIPIRGGDGRYPVAGWDSRNDWTGRIPFEELPHVLNPPAGYVVAANQRVIGDRYPYPITSDWDFGYRSQRIDDLLTQAPGPLDGEAVAALQLDSYNGNAPHLTPYLFGTAVNQGAAKARDLLREWDFTQPEGSPAAAYYNAVWRHLLTRTFDELAAENAPDGGGRWFEVVRGLLAIPDSPWWDIRATAVTETRDDVLRTAMEDAATELTTRLGPDPVNWRWGDLHTLTLRHQTFGRSGLGPMEWLFNRGPYPTSGGNAIVNANAWNAREGYQVTWVPSMRMVVDLGDLDRSRWINLTGSSGHAFSRHYVDQTQLWRAGGTTPMRWDAGEIARTARHTQRLVP
ncbi:MAG TPA: penicillin acylase family protein, partial [Cryptosporangiaceae bacterium]|nr:penicillin acylase family protein [Cryptosporangiaceae bacterium]